MIKLEEGKKYKTRNGKKVSVEHKGVNRFKATYEDGSESSFIHGEDGRYKPHGRELGTTYPEDIVSLWDEPETPPSTVSSIGILSAARQHMEDRAITYDIPEGERSMAQTVEVFNLFHGTTLTEAQGWHFMQILKDVRLFTRDGYHADSAEDCVSYSALKAEAKAKEKVNV